MIFGIPARLFVIFKYLLIFSFLPVFTFLTAGRNFNFFTTAFTEPVGAGVPVASGAAVCPGIVVGLAVSSSFGVTFGVAAGSIVPGEFGVDTGSGIGEISGAGVGVGVETGFSPGVGVGVDVATADSSSVTAEVKALRQKFALRLSPVAGLVAAAKSTQVLPLRAKLSFSPAPIDSSRSDMPIADS